MSQQAISKRLKAMGMIQMQGNCIPYELKPRDVEWRFFACEQLLQRQNQKGLLHCIVTGNEKYVHYDHSKRKKSWGILGVVCYELMNRVIPSQETGIQRN